MLVDVIDLLQIEVLLFALLVEDREAGNLPVEVVSDSVVYL